MTYTVRIWLDLKVTADSEEEAREICRKVPIEVSEREGKVEYYDSQVADVWKRDESS